MTFLEQFSAARRVSTPLVNIRTFDTASTVAGITKLLESDSNINIDETPLILWDVMNGARALNDAGKDELSKLLAKTDTAQEATAVLPELLRISEQFSEDTILFASNAHLFWSGSDSAVIVQGIWNLRDIFKKHGNMLALLSAPGSTLPTELINDILVMDEPLPTLAELETTVRNVYEYAEFGEPSADILLHATDALIGLPAFPAEQSTAMSLDKETKAINLSQLWERKRQVINQTPGLTVWQGNNKLENLGGLRSAKEFVNAVMHGIEPPRTIIFTDEVEKAFAGSGTDMSGVKTELTGAVLSWAQDKEIDGLLCLGVPGVGKSELAKSLGGTFGTPVINFDLAGMQAGIVGSSGANLRSAIATVNAISAGKILWIATCNSVNALPPELRSRFGLGTFFFDVPNDEESAAIWAIYRTRYSIPESESLPNDAGWTGREIKECCKKAYRMCWTLKEASRYIVPVTVSSRDIIESLRVNSSGKYLSASNPGIYTYSGQSIPQVASVSQSEGRKVRQ